MNQALTLIIGAAGAIGKALTAGILEKHGEKSVLAALRNTALEEPLASRVVSEFGVDVQNEESLRELFAKHAGEVEVVWNLAAPLSVDTAKDPKVAFDVTVGGMERLLKVMQKSAVKRICFSDSIGSFGAESPRENASAAWLTEHPTQDPGSDYGIQKRGCRELMKRFADEHDFDTRFTVIPGVLHAESTWGGGTTEYALDALLAAVEGREFVCPVPTDEALPMIYRDDLVRGMIALMDAPREALKEPEQGYVLAGFSFTAEELFAEIRKHYPEFSYRVDLNPSAATFAKLWPNTVSGEAAKRDLEFEAKFGLPETVLTILQAHQARLNS